MPQTPNTHGFDIGKTCISEGFSVPYLYFPIQVPRTKVLGIRRGSELPK